MADNLAWAASFSPFVLWQPAAYLHRSATAQFLQAHLDPDRPFLRAAALSETSVSQNKAAGYRVPMLNGEDSLIPSWYADRVNLMWNEQTLLRQPRTLLDALGVVYVVTSGSGVPFATSDLGDPVWSTRISSLPPGPLRLEIRGSVAIPGPWPQLSVTLISGHEAETIQVQASWAHHIEVSLPADWPRNRATEIRLQNESWDTEMWVRDVRVLDGAGREVQAWPVSLRLGPRGWTRAAAFGNEQVWKNPDVVAPAWVTPDRRAPLVVENGAGARPLSIQPAHQTWAVNGTGGWLVISQTYDPDWQATVDGHPATLQPVDGILTGVTVPAGNHRVELVYRPQWFYFGLWFSGCAWLLWGLGLIAARSSARRRA
jgi:hypothetical protein